MMLDIISTLICHSYMCGRSTGGNPMPASGAVMLRLSLQAELTQRIEGHLGEGASDSKPPNGLAPGPGFLVSYSILGQPEGQVRTSKTTMARPWLYKKAGERARSGSARIKLAPHLILDHLGTTRLPRRSFHVWGSRTDPLVHHLSMLCFGAMISWTRRMPLFLFRRRPCPWSSRPAWPGRKTWR